MNIYIFTLITFFILLFIGLLIWAIIRISRKVSIDIPPNSPIIFSLDQSKFSGHVIGVLKEYRGQDHSGRKIVVMKPIDLPYDGDGKPIETELKESAIRNEKINQLPIGALSFHRSIIIISPESSVDLNQQFRNTPLGTSISKGVEMTDYIDQGLEAAKRRSRQEKSGQAMIENDEHQIITRTRGYLDELTRTGQSERKTINNNIGDDKK